MFGSEKIPSVPHRVPSYQVAQKESPRLYVCPPPARRRSNFPVDRNYPLCAHKIVNEGYPIPTGVPQPMLGTEALGKLVREDEVAIYPLEFPNPKDKVLKLWALPQPTSRSLFLTASLEPSNSAYVVQSSSTLKQKHATN